MCRRIDVYTEQYPEPYTCQYLASLMINVVAKSENRFSCVQHGVYRTIIIPYSSRAPPELSRNFGPPISFSRPSLFNPLICATTSVTVTLHLPFCFIFSNRFINALDDPSWPIISPPSSVPSRTRSIAPSTTRLAPADTATAAPGNTSSRHIRRPS